LAGVVLKPLTGIIFAALVAVWCIWLWQPEHQIRLHQRHLLEAAEKRDWRKLVGLIDDDFRTPKGLDKTAALKDLATALQPFLTVTITDSGTAITHAGNIAHLFCLLRIDGLGSPFAESIKSAVNQSDDRFEFIWQRKSWKPWDWHLISVKHPLVSLAPQEMPF